MKKLLLAAAAAMTLTGSLVGAASADPGDRRGDRRELRDDRQEMRQDLRRGDYREYRQDRREYGRDLRDARRDWRDDRRDARWDRGRHNGYWYRNAWHYGPPPAAYYGRRDFYLGYSAWRPGYRIPAYYDGPRYVVYDYDRYHLRHPPRGYRWVRDDRGDFLLAAIATGIIADVIINSR